MVGGAITDKLGRRWMLLFGIIISGLSSLLMGFVNDISFFYVLTLLVGFLENTGGPAQQAMVADLVPEEKRAGGYGIQRVAVNLSVVVGPAIGGLIASQSYFWLFVLDAVLSMITAVIVFFSLPETMPVRDSEQTESESLVQSVINYKKVLLDGVYMAFILISFITILVYSQLNSTLAVYLRDYHDVATIQFGYLLSINAALVVLLQLWVTRHTDHYPPMLMMALGAFIHAIGFAMYGMVDSYILFVAAMIIITVGEMVSVPVAQSLAAHFAPEDMRGRYMAVFGFSWSLPFGLGPLAAGIIMDRADPRLVWYACGMVGIVATFAFIRLHISVRDRFKPAVEKTVGG
jgi:MFS family permease